jgi:hypothetical protein
MRSISASSSYPWEFPDGAMRYGLLRRFYPIVVVSSNQSSESFVSIHQDAATNPEGKPLVELNMVDPIT